MTTSRPPVEDLTAVSPDNLVFRLVQPAHLDLQQAVGAQLQTAALPTNQCTPNERSYGASIYVESLLSGGLEELHRACPKWQTWRAARIPVEKVVDLGVKVVLSPQDCPFESIRHAHASLLGVDKQRRNKLIKLIEAHLLPA